jgi:peroxin-16
MVTKNANTVGQIESALRSLIYIIPGKSCPDSELWWKLIAVGRFREYELPSECGKKQP